jgi:hypothetical protein
MGVKKTSPRSLSPQFQCNLGFSRGRKTRKSFATNWIIDDRLRSQIHHCNMTIKKSPGAMILATSQLNQHQFITAIMVTFLYLAVALSAIARSLAAPTESAPLFTRDLEDRAPDLDFRNVSRLMARQDYTQNYKTGGNVNFTPKSNGYSVTFSNADDFVVGKGWSTGSARYHSSFSLHQALLSY